MPKQVRIAAMADVHYGKELKTSLSAVYRELSEKADVLLLCGDLTNYGLPEEAQVAVQDLRAVTIPIVSVLGNHVRYGRAARHRAGRESAHPAGECEASFGNLTDVPSAGDE